MYWTNQGHVPNDSNHDMKTRSVSVIANTTFHIIFVCLRVGNRDVPVARWSLTPYKVFLIVIVFGVWPLKA